MGKIGIITDIHGNLPALQAILAELDSQGVDEIIHLGDVVDMAPYSKECLDVLSARNDVTLLMGNHDLDFVRNDYIAKFMSHTPTEHKQYVFSTLSDDDRQKVAAFPLYAERICGGQKLAFVHYAFDRNACFHGIDDFAFLPFTPVPSATEFDDRFSSFDCDAVFFGHKHEPCDIVGKRLYVDVGSVGCHPEPLATGIIVDYDDKSWSYRRIAVSYDMTRLEKDIVTIPCGQEIYDFYFLRKKPS